MVSGASIFSETTSGFLPVRKPNLSLIKLPPVRRAAPRGASCGWLRRSQVPASRCKPHSTLPTPTLGPCPTAPQSARRRFACCYLASVGVNLASIT